MTGTSSRHSAPVTDGLMLTHGRVEMRSCCTLTCGAKRVVIPHILIRLMQKQKHREIQYTFINGLSLSSCPVMHSNPDTHSSISRLHVGCLRPAATKPGWMSVRMSDDERRQLIMSVFTETHSQVGFPLNKAVFCKQ